MTFLFLMKVSRCRDDTFYDARPFTREQRLPLITWWDAGVQDKQTRAVIRRIRIKQYVALAQGNRGIRQLNYGRGSSQMSTRFRST